MKKLLCMSLSLLLLLSGCGEGSKENTTQTPDPESSAQVEEMPEELTFQLGGFTSGSSYDLNVINPYYDSITLSLVSVSANGWSISGTGAGVIPQRGSGTVKLTLVKEDLQRAGIESVQNIRARFKLTNSNGEYVKYEECHIGDDTINPSALSGANVVWSYDNAGIKVSAPLYVQDVVSGKNTVICMVENQSDTELQVSVADLIANGTSRPYSGTLLVQKHTNGILSFKTTGDDVLNGQYGLTSLSTKVDLKNAETGELIQQIQGQV